METIADILKMDREKQSQPINTAEVFVVVFLCSLWRVRHMLRYWFQQNIISRWAAYRTTRRQTNSRSVKSRTG